MKFSDLRPLIIPIVLLAGLALAVLYVILLAPVHAPNPPDSLARLVLAKSPKTAPDVAFIDASGRRHLLSQFRGRTILLNLWATNCVPCLRELPALATLARSVPPSTLTVVAVNIPQGGGGDDPAHFLADNKASDLTLYVDTDRVFLRAFRTYGLPLSVVIDPQGREIARALGASDWDAPDAIAYMKLLARQP